MLKKIVSILALVLACAGVFAAKKPKGNEVSKSDLAIENAKKLFEEEDYKAALKIFRKKAKKSQDAQLYLGICDFYGLGERKDEFWALSYYLAPLYSDPKTSVAIKGKAAAVLASYFGASEELESHTKRNEWREIMMEQLHFYTDRYSKSQELFKKSAELHRENNPGEQGEKEFFAWIKKLAELGNASAQHELAKCYLDGIGVEKNLSQFFEWVQKSAEQNNIDGLLNLGIAYDNGWGCEQNGEKAVECWKKAISKDKNFVPPYECMYTHFNRLQRYDLAIDSARIAAKLGSADASAFMGDCYWNGRGVEKDTRTALLFYMEASGRDSAYATYFLASYYMEGKAWNHAKEYGERASKLGNIDGTMLLANAHRFCGEYGAAIKNYDKVINSQNASEKQKAEATMLKEQVKKERQYFDGFKNVDWEAVKLQPQKYIGQKVKIMAKIGSIRGNGRVVLSFGNGIDDMIDSTYDNSLVDAIVESKGYLKWFYGTVTKGEFSIPSFHIEKIDDIF